MNLPFQIVFDFSWIATLGNKPFYYLLWYFFIKGGWIIISMVILWGLYEIFLFTRQNAFAKKVKYIFLAIDVPRQNLQSPRAVENIFSTLAGAHTPLEWEEKLFDGAFQLGFSIEIIAIDGYVQYVIRTPIQWRDLVESAIYSQYPDAEITEVEDYAKQYKNVVFPNDEYKIWGADLTLYNKEYFPIRTYPDFEDLMNKDIKDPLSTLLEVMNKMKTGEQFWYQILVYPTDTSWTKQGTNAIRKLVGQPVEETKKFMDKIDAAVTAPLSWMGEAVEQLVGGGVPAKPEKKQERLPFLPPMEQDKVKAITRKIAKIGFYCKARIVYFGKAEVFNKGLGVSGTFGAIKQFSDLNLNGFKPDKNKTQARWPLFKQSRLTYKQNNILQAYINRDAQTASPRYILNIEELATLYHFPYFEFRGPRMKRIESKKMMAPESLPMVGGIGLPVVELKTVDKQKQGDKVPVVDYDDDYFEKRFAKDKTGETDRKRKAEILAKLQAEGKISVDLDDDNIEESDDLESQFAKEPVQGTIARTPDEEDENDDEENNFNPRPPSNLPVI